MLRSLSTSISTTAIALALVLGVTQPAHADEAASVRDAVAVNTAQSTTRLSRVSDQALPDLSAVAFPQNARERADAPMTLSVAQELNASDARFVVAAPKKRWRGVLAAYTWATSIKGTQYNDGEETDIDAEFSDLFDKLKYAFMGYGEIGYEKWSFAIDASTLKLEDSRGGPAGRASLDASLVQTIIDLRLGYNLWSCQKGSARWGTCCYPRMMTVDVVAGARYWNLDTDLQIRGPAGGVTQRSPTVSWWDPYVGGRWRYQFAKRWGVTAYADIGGFGIGDASELTWQLQAVLRYNITRRFFVALGYRAIDVDRAQGATGAQNGIDALYHGPILGLGYTF